MAPSSPSPLSGGKAVNGISTGSPPPARSNPLPPSSAPCHEQHNNNPARSSVPRVPLSLYQDSSIDQHQYQPVVATTCMNHNHTTDINNHNNIDRHPSAHHRIHIMSLSSSHSSNHDHGSSTSASLNRQPVNVDAEDNSKKRRSRENRFLLLCITFIMLIMITITIVGTAWHHIEATTSTGTSESTITLQTNTTPTEKEKEQTTKQDAAVLPLVRFSPTSASIPAPLAAYYVNNYSFPLSFHNSFFNEPYMMDRDTPSGNLQILSSNRALPHMFPSPLPLALNTFAHDIVIGVFCYDVLRIEIILDGWGKFLQPNHLMIFSEFNSNPLLQTKQEKMPNVYILNNSANAHRTTTDRRASAWKILPAVKMMHEKHPLAEWYYICDDDSFPSIPTLTLFAQNLYREHPTTFTPQHAMYIGESVTHKDFFKGYYADQPGLQIDLRYHGTGGGVLMNKMTVDLLYPHLDTCFVFYASDMSLGHCIQQHVHNVSLIEIIDIPNTHRLYARSMEEVMARVGGCEVLIWDAAAFHHMREPFIEQWGVKQRLEYYLRESELRSHAAYLWTMQELVNIREQETDTITTTALTTTGNMNTITVTDRKMRVLIAMAESKSVTVTDISSLLVSLMNKEGWQPVSFLTQLGLDADVLLIDSIDIQQCSTCDLYGEKRSGCLDAYQTKQARFYPHVQKQLMSKQGKELTYTTINQLQEMKFHVYDLILSADAILSPTSTPSTSGIPPLYVHSTHSSCSFSSGVSHTPYSYALINEISLIDSLHTRSSLHSSSSSSSSSSSVQLLPFPSLSLYYGIYHALHVPGFPAMHAAKAPVVLLMGEEQDIAMYVKAFATIEKSIKYEMISIVDGVNSNNNNHIIPLELMVRMANAQVCIFTPDFITDKIHPYSMNQRRHIIHTILVAIASGCLCVISEEISRWSLTGESLSTISDGGLGLLFGPGTIVPNLTTLKRVLSEALYCELLPANARGRYYGVEVGYERNALNAHFLEKPWHRLMQKLKQHRDTLESDLA